MPPSRPASMMRAPGRTSTSRLGRAGRRVLGSEYLNQPVRNPRRFLDLPVHFPKLG
jgi:hypothetical protein